MSLREQPAGDGLPDGAGGASSDAARDPSRRTGLITLSVLVGLAALFALLVALPSIFAPPPPSEVSSARIGTRDHAYAAPGVQAPTGRKTEAAKLWYHDGTWWGILFQPSKDAYTINRFDERDDRWVDTGTIVDDRNSSQADVLWDGDHLYGVSGGTDPASDDEGPIIIRMSYDQLAGTYRMDRGFPVQVAPRGSEMFTLDKDDTGRLWVTWTADRSVWITHSLVDDRHWSAPSILPTDQASNISPDDISAVVAYEGRVGIMWSDQVEGSMLWASAPAGADAKGPWTVTTVIRAPAMGDDHMNLKALRDDPAGLVFAAVKTSRNDLPNANEDDPLILLLVLHSDGTWSRHLVSTVKQNETRPLLLIDTDHRKLHVLTSAPCCSGGTIYERITDLDNIEFDPASREAVLRRGRTSALNNAAAAKHPLTAETGMLVIASDDNVRWYMHLFRPLTGEVVPKPSRAPVTGTEAGPGSGAEPRNEVANADFETGVFTGWQVSKGPTPGSIVTVDGDAARTDRFGLRLSADGDAASFAFARLAVPPGGPSLGVDLDFAVLRQGADDGNVPLLRLLATDGTRLVAVYRQNGGSGQLWIRTPDSRESTLARVELTAWTHLALTVTTVGETALADLRVDGRLVGQVTLPAATAKFATIQVGNDTSGQPFEVTIDNVRVRR